jgi:DMSO/TMAO reductase YedYZ heme-binding membrane subunit
MTMMVMMLMIMMVKRTSKTTANDVVGVISKVDFVCLSPLYISSMARCINYSADNGTYNLDRYV